MADRSDWRWCRQDEYLTGVRLHLAKFQPRPHDPWDHDHSDFCWQKIADWDGEDIIHEAYRPGDVTFTVEIPYLRAMLPEPGDSFLIRLKGCSLLECRLVPFDELSDAAQRYWDGFRPAK